MTFKGYIGPLLLLQKQIKNEHGVVLRDLDMIIGRWKGYFDKLLNEENPRSIFDDGVPNEGLTQGISRNEVKVAISRMKHGKATGMDGIPVEVWKCLGEEGIDMLWDLMLGIGVYTSKGQSQRSGDWRDSVIIPIYKCDDNIDEYLAILGKIQAIKPGVHTNDFATIHGRPARIHTAPAESTIDSTYCLPQALCEYARGDRESWRNR